MFTESELEFSESFEFAKNYVKESGDLYPWDWNLTF